MNVLEYEDGGFQALGSTTKNYKERLLLQYHESKKVNSKAKNRKRQLCVHQSMITFIGFIKVAITRIANKLLIEAFTLYNKPSNNATLAIDVFSCTVNTDINAMREWLK